MPILEVENVHKAFWIPAERRDTIREHALALFRPRRRERLRVLEGISFSLERGETMGIMGRNGCGKSTLLKLVTGIYQPDQGRVACHAALTPILELGVGWNPELDAIDNIQLIGTVMGQRLRELRAAIPEILAFAGLERFSRLQLKHYSTGMAARLAYAVAFQAVHEVLILDEIMAVGDAEFRARCEQRFGELHRAGHTMLMVSHDPATIATCDRALLLDEGRLKHQGSGAAIARAYQELLGQPAEGG